MSKGNPWKTLQSRVVYKNPWISVREDEVIQPDGAPGIYGVLDTRIANGIVALTPEREVYLVGQYRYPNDIYSWEIIEGGTDPGEEPLACAKRELKEEAGLVAKRWHPLGHEMHLSNCVTSEVGYLYIAEDLTEGEPEPDATEILQLKKIPFEDAVAMVESGEIVDALTIMGLLLAERWLAKNG